MLLRPATVGSSGRARWRGESSPRPEPHVVGHRSPPTPTRAAKYPAIGMNGAPRVAIETRPGRTAILRRDTPSPETRETFRRSAASAVHETRRQARARREDGSARPSTWHHTRARTPSLGVYAACDVPAREILMEYVGEVIRRPVADRRESAARRAVAAAAAEGRSPSAAELASASTHVHPRSRVRYHRRRHEKRKHHPVGQSLVRTKLRDEVRGSGREATRGVVLVAKRRGGGGVDVRLSVRAGRAGKRRAVRVRSAHVSRHHQRARRRSARRRERKVMDDEDGDEEEDPSDERRETRDARRRADANANRRSDEC